MTGRGDLVGDDPRSQPAAAHLAVALGEILVGHRSLAHVYTQELVHALPTSGEFECGRMVVRPDDLGKQGGPAGRLQEGTSARSEQGVHPPKKRALRAWLPGEDCCSNSSRTGDSC